MAARLAWPGADRYRPYDTARAGETGERSAETLSFELLGRVEKLGDPRTMTAARVLRGDTTQARRELVLDRRTPDADSDRAAIALVEGKPEDALLAAAAAVESDPQHVQATWNRALALERLGMPLTAAEAFEAVAGRGEPGWSQEASERATALRAQFQRRRSAWEAANAAGAQLVAGGLVDDATLTAYPSLMRRYLYEAVRTAESAERMKALRPIAATLDSHFGGSHLTGYADRIARSDFRRRAPLAARYAVLARREMKDPAAVQALLRDLRAGRQEDILLGALLHAGPSDWRPNKEQLDEYLALARATHDPWLQLEAEVNVDLRADQFSLGCVLYELLTGRTPFQRASAVQTMAAVIQDEPPPLAEIDARIPRAVAHVVERCLAKDPDRRYLCTRDLERDLELTLRQLSEPCLQLAAAAASAPAGATAPQVLWRAGVMLMVGALLLTGGVANEVWPLRRVRR